MLLLKLLSALLVTGALYSQEIVLIRHGEFQGDDLTEVGINQVMTSIALIKEKVKKVDCVYYSPKARTKQTALTISKENGDCRIVELGWLNDDNEVPLGYFSQLVGDSIIIVTHSPTLVRLSRDFGTKKDRWKFADYEIISR